MAGLAPALALVMICCFFATLAILILLSFFVMHDSSPAIPNKIDCRCPKVAIIFAGKNVLVVVSLTILAVMLYGR